MLYKKLNIANLPRRTLILGSLRLIILFMEANFLVLFALGILSSVHTCVSNVKMRKANKFLSSQPRIFPLKFSEPRKKEARRQTGYWQLTFSSKLPQKKNSWPAPRVGSIQLCPSIQLSLYSRSNLRDLYDRAVTIII